MKYNKITKEEIEEILKDITYQKTDTKRKIVIYCWGYEDENGNIRSGFLEELDKAMKEEIKKRYGE